MDENTSICFLLRVVNTSFRGKVNQHIRKTGLTFTQTEVLFYLLTRNQERISIKEIADFMELSHPTMIEVIKRLEQKGYVSNVPDEKDRRCRNIQLTEKTFDLKDEMYGFRAELDDLLLQGISPEETAQLRSVLLRIVANLTKISEKIS